MIPAEKTVVVEDNFAAGVGPGFFESRRIDFDPAAMSYMLKLVIDLYSDKELAVLRELSTNARDSHVMAGRADVPIEVELPGPLSQYLVIRDFGLGLSVEEIYSLFGRLGASTKRNTNEATGMLGVGSKSPLTYTNQFTMKAVKDGVRAVVSISREADGVGKLTVVDTSATSDPNGVEIKIPVAMQNSFAPKAASFFQVWKPGTVLVNGKEPKGFEEAMWVTDSIALIRHDSSRYQNHNSYVVMGNVPYPAPALAANNLGLDTYTYSIVAHVPIGAVEFAPAREALADDPKTKSRLNQIRDEFKRGLQDAIQKEVQDAKTPREALLAYHRWVGAFRGVGTFTAVWQGRKLPTKIEPPHMRSDGSGAGRVIGVTIHGGGRGKGTNYGSQGYSHLIDSTVFVTGFDGFEVTANMRKKLAHLVSERDLKAARTGFFLDWDFSAYAEYCDPDYLVTWADVKAVKLPKQPRYGTARIPGSFDIVQVTKGLHPSQKRGVPGDELDQKNPIYFIHGNTQEGMWYLPIMDQFHDHYTIICLPENRIAKFKRDNPSIKNLKAEIRERAQKLSDKMTEDQKKALWLADNAGTLGLSRFQSCTNDIDDPDLKELIRLSVINLNGIRLAQEKFRGEVQWPKTKVDFTAIKRYPYLFRSYSSDPRIDAHAIRYINAEYAYLVSKGV